MPNILLVEDAPEQVLVFSRSLKLSGTLTVAGTMTEATRLISEGTYDLIVLDLSLPDSTANETLRWTQEIRGLVPVVILTASTDEEVLAAVEHSRLPIVNKSSPRVLYQLRETVSRLLHAAPVIVDKAEVVHVDRSHEVQVIGDIVRVNGESVPTDKWKFLCWMAGKASKNGPVAFVLSILVGWYIYDGSESRKRDEVRQTSVQATLQVLAINQTTLIDTVKQKNETINANRDLLISSRDRDEKIIKILFEISAQMQSSPDAQQETTNLLKQIKEGIDGLKSSSWNRRREMHLASTGK